MNSLGCICGGAACTTKTGLFCTSSLSRCSTTQACPHKDGSTTNSAGCACGHADCTSTSGLYCYSNISHCGPSPISACVKTDGLSANPQACVCGARMCNSTTGLFCVASRSSCTSSVPLTYLYVNAGLCASEDGRGELGTEADCEKAAVFLGISDVSTNTGTYFLQGVFRITLPDS